MWSDVNGKQITIKHYHNNVFRDGQNSLTSLLIIIFKGGLYMAAFVNPNKIQKTHYDIQPDPGLDLGHASSTRRPCRSTWCHCRAHAATVDLHATTESTQLLQPSSQWSTKSAQPPLYRCRHPHHVLCEYARVTDVERESTEGKEREKEQDLTDNLNVITVSHLGTTVDGGDCRWDVVSSPPRGIPMMVDWLVEVCIIWNQMVTETQDTRFI
jgi:hypothetical protein